MLIQSDQNQQPTTSDQESSLMQKTTYANANSTLLKSNCLCEKVSDSLVCWVCILKRMDLMRFKCTFKTCQISPAINTHYIGVPGKGTVLPEGIWQECDLQRSLLSTGISKVNYCFERSFFFFPSM